MTISQSVSSIKDSIMWRIMDTLNIRDYGMFSIRGNAKVAAMVKQAQSLSPEEQQEFVSAEMTRIEKRHPEVYDTDVREDIQESVQGYDAYSL